MWRTAWIRIWMESCVVNREFYKQSWDGTGTSLSESRFLKVAIIPGGGILPYISYIVMCRPKGYGFWAFLVWKRAWILEVTAWGLKTGLENGMFWSEIGRNRGQDLVNQAAQPNQEFPGVPSPPPRAIIPTCVKCHARHFQVAPAEPLFQSEAKWEAIHVFFILMQIKLIFTRKVLQLRLFWKWGFWKSENGQNHLEWNSWRPLLNLESERKFRRPVYISSIQSLIISKLHSRLFQTEFISFSVATKIHIFYWNLFNLY